MEEDVVRVLNKLIRQLKIKNANKENIFIKILRKVFLDKHYIDVDFYYKLISEKLKNINLDDLEIEITDEICEKIKSVNPLFLCSMFENFIGDGKRETTGSYYTPLYIVDFIVNNSLKTYLEKNSKLKSDLIEKLVLDNILKDIDDEELYCILKLLDNIKIIDIACGTGLFLISMIQKLFKIKSAIYKDLNIYYDEFDELKKIMEENIFGIDIQSLPLEVFYLACIDVLGKYKKIEIDDFHINVYQENSILGSKIYDIPKLKEIIKRGGFDIVIGNPPYIGEKGNKDKFKELKKYDFGKRYYEGKMDYFYFFVYRGIEILKYSGVLSFITTNYFISADGATKLRKFLKENVSIKTIINFNDCKIFKNAKGQHNLIFTLIKGFSSEEDIMIIYFNNKDYKAENIKEIIFNNSKFRRYEGASVYKLSRQENIYGDNGNLLVFYDKEYLNIIKKIIKKSNKKLKDICYINQGIVSGADRVTSNMINKKLSEDLVKSLNIKLDDGIFVLDRKNLENINISNCKLIKPFYKNSDVRKYYTKNKVDKYIIYLTDKNIEYEHLCPIINNHLIRFREVLDKRREVLKGVRKWYSLQWAREEKIFQGPKIVVPQRSTLNSFGYNESDWYASADVYFITPRVEDIDLKILLGILNSKIIYFWLYNMGKRKGNYLELYTTPLSEIPINLKLDDKLLRDIKINSEKILKLLKDGYNPKIVNDFQGVIDERLYKFYDFTEDEIKIIEELYNKAQGYV
ncbi:adenine-specific DNA-methyltransferase [Caminicella sporogenes DSM 14501]|uniref:site-specific DNA-methyltransferase (adenine-specific) n=1 Tax=Caminicella sporogenes DSM 14501 TaxID=1121266 RepID=A0A1M6MEF4_9FIRM|nr:TaqI-like C-terminal specificity domain-containing protein [Caminicella sporogenes]RKD27586.1 hypothetical protein BET04_00510 [Caminicella sporogenes]SHJ81746.1 adenine-specific DNA-methyltransferase [Caminicella sporogenes DSM 14501]